MNCAETSTTIITTAAAVATTAATTTSRTTTADYSKLTLSTKKSFMKCQFGSRSDQHFVGPVLGLKCLQRK